MVYKTTQRYSCGCNYTAECDENEHWKITEWEWCSTHDTGGIKNYVATFKNGKRQEPYWRTGA